MSLDQMLARLKIETDNSYDAVAVGFYKAEALTKGEKKE